MSFSLGALSANEVTIVPESVEDFGSGAAIRADFYIPGSHEKGMMIGHANTNTRRDRALVRFSLKSLLSEMDKVKGVTLALYIERVVTFDPGLPRRIGVEHAEEEVEKLDGAVISTGRMESVGEVDAEEHHTIFRSGSKARKPEQPEPVSIDVTDFVKKDLEEGKLTSTFRIRDLQSEEKGTNDTGGSIGVIISTEESFLPQLIVRTAQ